MIYRWLSMCLLQSPTLPRIPFWYQQLLTCYLQGRPRIVLFKLTHHPASPWYNNLPDFPHQGHHTFAVFPRHHWMFQQWFHNLNIVYHLFNFTSMILFLPYFLRSTTRRSATMEKLVPILENGSDRIQDSLWNNIYMWIDYIYLRIRISHFEMFASSLIHERILKITALE